jgi:hypothetical protein
MTEPLTKKIELTSDIKDEHGNKPELGAILVFETPDNDPELKYLYNAWTITSIDGLVIKEATLQYDERKSRTIDREARKFLASTIRLKSKLRPKMKVKRNGKSPRRR